MDYGISGKRAIISGATAGIGLATAEALLREGVVVTITGRRRESVDAAVAGLRQRVPGAKAEGAVADVATAAGCAALIAAVPDCDILINNLGIYEIKPFEQIEDSDWLRFFETNVMSGIRLSRHYVAGMRARDWGRVVFLSSDAALHVPPALVHYGVTKTAQLAVARGLAETLAGTNVTVNSVLPGPTATESANAFIAQMAQGSDRSMLELQREFMQSARPTSLLQRFVTTEEVAAMIAYLCSVQAAATTGTALRIDGGVVRTVV
jgi:NAD(P)-dependent dehydrogenase (short-subunit alcohol dehydrogenase family)